MVMEEWYDELRMDLHPTIISTASQQPCCPTNVLWFQHLWTKKISHCRKRSGTSLNHKSPV
eukprot:489888-Pyramimonas_sp.AAC.1